MPYERAKKFTRYDEKSICQFAQTHFPHEQRMMTFFFNHQFGYNFEH